MRKVWNFKSQKIKLKLIIYRLDFEKKTLKTCVMLDYTPSCSEEDGLDQGRDLGDEVGAGPGM